MASGRAIPFSSMFSAAGCLLALLGVCFGIASAQAAVGARNMERETQIENELQAAHPDLVEPFRAARIAFDKEDYAESERLLRPIIAKVPDYDVALRRLGSCLVREHKSAEGLEFCERGVAVNRSTENLSTLAYALVAGGSRDQNRANSERALELLRECRAKPGGNEADLLALTAQIALELNNRPEFEAAYGLMAAKYPTEPFTHYLAGIAAALDQRWLRAESEIKQAEKLGLPHEMTQKLLDSGIRSAAARSRLWRDAALLFGCWAGGLVLLFGLGFLLSKVTLGQIRPAETATSISGGEKLIRKIYRVVLNLAGVYYYISLPVVILVVIGVVGFIFYLCLMIGQIPIKLMLVLAIGALLTITAMVKSLFIRVKAPEPGRVLQRKEAEGLWQLAEEVAQSVGTRPIDEIRITPGTDLAVYERGTWRQKLRNEAHRILIVGTGVLNGFKQNDFRCVLAHEYGHFSNRDTAGGDIALRVRNDMLKFYFAMRAARQATYFNAAFHFLRIYNFIFRRISHGATRLQEILADRVAAQIYGALAFQEGLTHVIRRSIEFEAAANDEIKKSVEARRPLKNLYELPAPTGAEVATEFATALSRATTEDDTHPSPQDRFRLVASLQQPACAPRPGEVWDLFADSEAIRREMVAEIEKRVASHRE